MSETWIVLLVASIPGLLGLAGAIVAILFATGERKARVAAERAGTKKTHAEINVMTSSEWKRLYDEVCRRIKKQDARIDRLDHELSIAKDYIQYLWLGTVENIHFMEGEGMEPPFKPRRNFRGSDDFDSDDWAWLGDTT